MTVITRRLLHVLTTEIIPRSVVARLCKRAVLFLNGLFTFSILLFPSLDGGFFSGALMCGSIAYWVGVYLIHRKRGQAWSVTDFIFLTLAQVACVAVCYQLFLLMRPYA